MDSKQERSMAFDADSMAERRRLTRKLSLWRVLAVAAGCLALVGIAIGVFGRSRMRISPASPSAA
jgi:anti-sigma-K factor RskA